MWQDPTDVTKRKPNRLRGTPSNRFANIVSIAFLASFYSFVYWFQNSEIEWIQRGRLRVLEKVKPGEHEAIRREMFADPYLQSIVNQANERLMDKEYGTVGSKEEKMGEF